MSNNQYIAVILVTVGACMLAAAIGAVIGKARGKGPSASAGHPTRIEQYLEKHLIVRIGLTIPGYICCEVIVDNPAELIAVVKKAKCYISGIRWWDRAEIESGSSIGYGGPLDPRDPDRMFFAETDICREFDASVKEKEYNEYFEQVRSAYPNHELYPAFDIKKK